LAPSDLSDSDDHNLVKKENGQWLVTAQRSAPVMPASSAEKNL
jgi:hypothetical protein